MPKWEWGYVCPLLHLHPLPVLSPHPSPALSPQICPSSLPLSLSTPRHCLSHQEAVLKSLEARVASPLRVGSGDATDVRNVLKERREVIHLQKNIQKQEANARERKRETRKSEAGAGHGRRVTRA